MSYYPQSGNDVGTPGNSTGIENKSFEDINLNLNDSDFPDLSKIDELFGLTGGETNSNDGKQR